MTNSCCCDNLPVCILHLGENGLEKYGLAKKWEQFKIVLLFMDHPVPLRDFVQENISLEFGRMLILCITLSNYRSLLTLLKQEVKFRSCEPRKPTNCCGFIYTNFSAS